MRAHDVRRLRYCETCLALDDRDNFITGEPVCVACAWRTAGSLETFTSKYDRSEWTKLPLNLIGVENMRALLALDAARGA